ncbi:VP23 [Psittacid alphaherpesvirus 1]|uniref:Triplex capsid protein 2 n=1 Tax=Psittacid herpesvirus 1 (isolate Amazon parrot/-/97-0001/1997) TaxID=670426 RepID=TRX2_PSHV1|nr:capsid triplex subunit 2 [Psittacid alphaherpesvirus 1]Q6UDI3.1 RecName: Full=Triplex capsid protein 2 [Psittacid herpesvirus 1 Amazon parrot/1997]AAQ73727.1 VP23 [Psittacid alphaherpesvirus 1]
MAHATSSAYEVKITLPGNLTRDEEDRLRCLTGTILMAPSLRRCLFLHDVDRNSYYVHGSEPDYATSLAAYRRRFPLLVTAVGRQELSAVSLSIGCPKGLNFRNTGPFQLLNGSNVSLIPPIGGRWRVELLSCGSVIEPAMTIPTEVGSELLGKILAGMTYEFCARNQIPADRPAEVYRVACDNKALDLTQAIRGGDSDLQDTMKTLFASVLFAMNEGVLQVMTLMPALLAGGNTNPFLNALLQMQSATRLSAQIFNPPTLPVHDPTGGARRYNVFDAFASWLTMSHRLGELFHMKPALKVVMFYSDVSAIDEGQTANAIVP